MNDCERLQINTCYYCKCGCSNQYCDIQFVKRNLADDGITRVVNEILGANSWQYWEQYLLAAVKEYYPDLIGRVENMMLLI